MQREATRLLGLGHTQARLQLGDRIARAFLLNQPATLAAFAVALDFNAVLCTELREEAKRRGLPSLWGEER